MLGRVDDLGEQERALLALLADRLRKGAKSYGALNVGASRKNLPHEALEELLDGIAYLAMALMQFLQLQDSGVHRDAPTGNSGLSIGTAENPGALAAPDVTPGCNLLPGLRWALTELRGWLPHHKAMRRNPGFNAGFEEAMVHIGAAIERIEQGVGPGLRSRVMTTMLPLEVEMGATAKAARLVERESKALVVRARQVKRETVGVIEDRILRMLSGSDSKSATQIADELGILRSSARRSLNVLARRGKVQRTADGWSKHRSSNGARA